LPLSYTDYPGLKKRLLSPRLPPKLKKQKKRRRVEV
jgi:hypothetical protein